jgi:hypothetical protein
MGIRGEEADLNPGMLSVSEIPDRMSTRSMITTETFRKKNFVTLKYPPDPTLHRGISYGLDRSNRFYCRNYPDSYRCGPRVQSPGHHAVCRRNHRGALRCPRACRRYFRDKIVKKCLKPLSFFAEKPRNGDDGNDDCSDIHQEGQVEETPCYRGIRGMDNNGRADHKG